MTPRFPKLSTRTVALLAGGLLLGATLAPVAAQQSGLDGQLAVRSDGAVYLISGGQRRWVATVAITDDELNAYPEAEPIYTALAPMGGGGQTAAAPPPAAAAPKPAAAASPATGGSAAPAAPAAPGAAPNPGVPEGTPTGATGQVNPSLPIEVDIDGSPKIEAGERLKLNIETKVGATCELTVAWPGGTEAPQPQMTADSTGQCRYSIVTPASTPAGTGTLKGVVKDGGVTSNQTVEFEIVPTV
jgi:hypothetical protein